MSHNDAPIVVLDSGLGGLTVVQAMHRAMPHERFVYFGDTARLPYGSKTAATVTLFVRQIIEFLQPLDPKHVVIACNTASALALPEVQESFPNLMITGVIEPGAQAAVEAIHQSAEPVVGVIGTEATVRSRAYVSAIQRLRQDAKVICRATPLLVPIIEEGRGKSDPVARLALEQYLQTILDQKPSALVLGCTHYPILRSLIQEMVGEGVRVIDSADQCAEDVRRRLKQENLLRTPPEAVVEATSETRVMQDVGAEPWLQCYVTDDSPRFATLASRFLGVTVRPPEVISPDLLYSGVTVVSDF
jgi:glutamate racemase